MIKKSLNFDQKSIPLNPPLSDTGRRRRRDGESGSLRVGDTYKSLFRRNLTDVPVEAITWRLTASEPPPRPELHFRPVGGVGYPDGVKGERPVFSPEEGRFVDHLVLDRYSLEIGATVRGPAIVEERESTVVVGPDARCSIDEHLNLVMDLG